METMYTVLLITVMILSSITVHLTVERFAENIVRKYLFEANNLLRARNYTDGCSSPFKTYIHRWLDKSHDLCAAHDYGSLGLITVARPGWHNNWVTWLAHVSQSNPVYWVWGTIVAIVTLPWVVWRRNFNIEMISMVPFYIFLFILITFSILVYYYGG